MAEEVIKRNSINYKLKLYRDGKVISAQSTLFHTQLSNLSKTLSPAKATKNDSTQSKYSHCIIQTNQSILRY